MTWEEDHIQNRLRMLVARFPRVERWLGRWDFRLRQRRVFSWPRTPPRAALARSMLQIRLIASTREISSRAYSCIVKMKLRVCG